MKLWIEGAVRGEPDAYEHLVKQFRGMAHTVAFHILKDEFWAEDVVQEAFTEAFSNLSRLDKPEAFPGWFKVIVERQCYRWLRRKRHAIIPVEELSHIHKEDQSNDPEQLLLLKEQNRMLHDLIGSLPSSMQLVVDMFYFKGYSLNEISDFLNVSISALKKRLFDARKKLRRHIPVADITSVFTNLYEGGEGMLHITNGDHAADRIRQSGIQGDVLVWRELYPFGPVSRDMAEQKERSRRVAYLERELGIPQSVYLQIAELERKLQSLHNEKEIVLWFEYDLYDQTMLSYLLHFFQGQSLGDITLHLLCIGSHPEIEHFRGLGQLTPKQIGSLSGTWHVIGAEEMEAGRLFWEAYTSQNIQDHIEFLTKDTSAYPFARTAFQAHLSRLPSIKNGLGIIEQTTLEAIREGMDRPYPLFKHVGDQLHWLGMGDLEYWAHLRRMSSVPNALLSVTGASRFPDFQQHSDEFRGAFLSLTPLGMQVLDEEVDWASLRREEAWFGGLRNEEGKEPRWRWDVTSKRVIVLE
ncbi:sigma-70 family RNA polymerase sigma factor [Paenibacillus tundrae]|uniref:sigma-70 family RNA polymerase sigma factor n=1 Tax=Paenibacillus tundrae TaxID=528187 RepID=UPI0030D11B60